jgi:hypothetical protein
MVQMFFYDSVHKGVIDAIVTIVTMDKNISGAGQRYQEV